MGMCSKRRTAACLHTTPTRLQACSSACDYYPAHGDLPTSPAHCIALATTMRGPDLHIPSPYFCLVQSCLPSNSSFCSAAKVTSSIDPLALPGRTFSWAHGAEQAHGNFSSASIRKAPFLRESEVPAHQQPNKSCMLALKPGQAKSSKASELALNATQALARRASVGCRQ